MKEARSDFFILVILIFALLFMIFNLNSQKEIFYTTNENNQFTENTNENTEQNNSISDNSTSFDSYELNNQISEKIDDNNYEKVHISEKTEDKTSENVQISNDIKKENIINNESGKAEDMQSHNNLISENNELSKKKEEPNLNILNNYVDNEIYYYYNQLTPNQKVIYQKISNVCHEYKSTASLNYADLEDVYIAETAVNYDHPEYYWMNAFTVTKIGEKVKEISFEVPSDAKSITNKIDYKVEEIFNKISMNISDYQKVKYFYDWIVENTEYENSSSSQDFTSVFLDNRSVCAGYSKAFLYLCQKANVECAYVVGTTVNNEPHAWNLVKLNGNYYWVDTTFGDPIFSHEYSNNTNYNYFCVSDEELLKNHTIDKNVSLQNYNTIYNVFSYPSCVDDSLNYYKIKKCYFYYYNKQEIEDFLKNKMENGIYTDIEIKFSDNESFKEFIRDFLDSENSGIMDVIKEQNPDFYGSINVSYSFVESSNFLRLSMVLNPS